MEIIFSNKHIPSDNMYSIRIYPCQKDIHFETLRAALIKAQKISMKKRIKEYSDEFLVGKETWITTENKKEARAIFNMLPEEKASYVRLYCGRTVESENT